MSLQYSDTTNKKGLAQFYEKELQYEYGYITGNSERFMEFTARVNMAIDNYLVLWAKNASTWQGDDMNHNDFQIITTAITSGRRNYPFITDENNNRIKDVSKVLILGSSTTTTYTEISPVDELNTSISNILVDDTTGVPSQYGKLSNAIFFDVIPNYTVADGIKMVVNREGSYVTTADTTKVIGVPAFHEYFYLKPAYEVARIKGLSNLGELEKAVVDLEGSERLRVRGKIAEFFSSREKDVRRVMSNKGFNHR